MSRGRPARFPPFGAWPAVMRADTAALMRAVGRGEVPRPSDVRMHGKSREPLWALENCRSFVVRRHELRADAEIENLADLV